MQGDILVPVYLFLRRETSVSNFLLVYFCLFVFFGLFFFNIICVRLLQTLSALTGLAVHAMPSAFGSHLFSPLWSSLVLIGAAGLPCMSPLASAIVWVGLCPFGRATFIGWCPLEPPHWSLGVVRWRGGALLVLLFLLFDLLNDLPDPPLCSLFEGHHMQGGRVNSCIESCPYADNV